MPRFLSSLRKSCNSYNPCNNNNDYCKDNVRFFSLLAIKLKNMAISINNRINELKNNSCKTYSKAFIFAAVDVPKMTIGVKQEYIIYITRYGPPDNGIFDPDKLELLRAELGINDSTYSI
jgi:hypothetical protein